MQHTGDCSMLGTMHKLTQFDYHHRLEDTRGIAIVMFSKHACAACRAWHQLLARYQALHPAIQLFTVDVEEETGLGEEMEIFYLPALFLYVNGQFHAPLQSVARLSQLEAAVQKALHLPAQEQP